MPSPRGWMGRLLAVVLLMSGSVAPCSLFAQGIPLASGRFEGAPFLLLPSGGRAVGMGRAMTAVRSPESVLWNPAGLWGSAETRILMTRGEHITGDALAVSLQGAGWNGFAGALTLQVLDEGSQDATDIDGNVVGSLTNRSHLAVFSMAQGWGERVQVGLNAKYFQFTLGCRGQCPQGRVRSSSYGIDGGIQVQPFDARAVHLGLAAVHLGPDFRNRDALEGDPLPARLRLGVSGTPWEGDFEGERLALLLSFDLEDRVREPGSPAILFGAEFSAGSADQLFVRGGYVTGQPAGLDGASVGFGFRFDRFDLDLARVLPRGSIASQQEPTHLTLGIRFP